MCVFWVVARRNLFGNTGNAVVSVSSRRQYKTEKGANEEFTTMAGVLFEDIFDVKDIDPEGKKFDRGKKFSLSNNWFAFRFNLVCMWAFASIPMEASSRLFVFPAFFHTWRQRLVFLKKLQMRQFTFSKDLKSILKRNLLSVSPLESCLPYPWLRFTGCFPFQFLGNRQASLRHRL